MQEIAQNRFNEGISKDVSALIQKDTTAIHMENVTVFTKENQNYVVTNIRGTDHEFSIPVNYTVIGSRTFANVCYLILAETLNGTATGKGQIGCFPSPAYTGNEGAMLNAYAPFKNYGGDNNQFPLKNGDFISSLFNFPVDRNVDVVIQRAYDGSVNVILTDGINPVRIINSGFSTVDGKTFKIVSRDAGNEDNRYTFEDFESTMNLVLTTKTLAKIEFQGIETGGKVKSGNYIYYFRYATNDGNESPFIGESSLVQVAFGDGIFSIKGGKGDGEDTNKQVRFKLTGLDRNYSFLIVYFMHSTGENSVVDSLYRVDTRIPIRNEEALFTHSGFENVLLEDSSVLQDIYGSMDTADALTEIQGYLIAGGIKQKSYDRTMFRTLARGFKLGHSTLDMEGGLGDLAQDSIKRTNGIKSKDFYGLGYYNPMNVYHGLGYWGGEAYPFGFRIILNNGDLTDVYPVLGCDNISGLRTLGQYSNYNFDQIDNSNQGFEPANGFNTKGIYRFPGRKVTGLYNAETDTIKVNGIKFTVPVIPDEIKKISKGIVFVRAERKPNVLSQGIITDMFKVPLDDRIVHDNKTSPLRSLSTYDAYDISYKLVPAPGFKLECPMLIKRDKEKSGNPGINYAHFSNSYGNNLYKQGGGWKDSFAFYSGENLTMSEKALSMFARSELKMIPLSDITFGHEIRTGRANNYLDETADPIINDHFSLLRPKLYEQPNIQSVNVRSTYVIGGNNQMIGEDRFSSECYFMDSEWRYGHVGVFPLSFDDYVGLKIIDDTKFTIGSPVLAGANIRLLSNNFGKDEKMAMLVNLYSDGGEWNTETLRQNWLDVSTVRYFPISERILWDDLETMLSPDRSVTFFRGDCFTVPSYKRLYINKFAEDEQIIDESIDQQKRANVGYTMSWMAEHGSNVALRTPLFDNINSADASTFAPFGKDLLSPSNQHGINSWRRTRQPETKGFNYGYSKTGGDSFGITVDFDRPFTDNDWYSRLMNSERHIPNAFVNGYRQWGFDLQDYDASKGRITKLMPFGNDILMIQEDGISVVPINQRMESATDTAGAVFVQSNEVLSPYQGYKSHHIGSQHPDSILMTENAVYGYDAKRFTWWKAGLDGSFISISDLSVGSFFEKHAKDFSTNRFNKSVSNIVAGWDIRNRQVFLSFFHNPSGEKFTLSYSEYTQFVSGFHAYHAFNFFTLSNRIYSIPVKDKTKVYLHDSDTQRRLLVYGDPEKAIIRFAVNKQHEANKVFDFLEIVSNNVLPDKIIYWIQGASAEQDVVYDPENIFLSNAKYREEKAVINVPRAGWKNDRSVTQYLEQQDDNATAQIFEGARIRGKVLVIELQYSTDRLLEISSVLTYFRKSLR